MLSGLLLSAAVLAPSAGPDPSPAAPPGPLLPALRATTQAPPPAESAPPPRSGTDTQAGPAAPQPTTTGPYAAQDAMAAGGGMGAPAKPSLQDDHLGPPYSLWARADYRMFWLKPAPLTAPLLVNAAGAPVVGGSNFDYGRTNGLGWETGAWLNDRHTIGLAAGGFLTEQRSVFATANSTGGPALARPILDVILAGPSQFVVAAPGTLAGSFWTQQTARVAGADVYGIRNLAYCPNYSFDFLAGFRYFDLDETLDITQVTRPIGGTVLSFLGAPNPAITAVTLNDHFHTRNQWWGGQIGVRGEYRFGPVFVGGFVKAGMGNNHQTVDIDGSTRAAGAGTAAGGLLALPGANMGQTTTNRFSVLTEAGATIGVQVSRAVRVYFGYNFFYLNNVVRPGQQIDVAVNPRLVPTSTTFGGLTGITSPLVTGVRDDFFLNALRFGVEVLY